ncbi:heat shock 70 kda protein [Plakobranchus ocellatus]|uniref:Heat shock 70 kDa protein n=1 Tax=Plakobranchus ocellatus TaxID=259542 RepID=A0AAV3YHG5_9GAST|nr:heat shock 70 kda protein [Plakobranchus ocellatus]
MTKSINAPAIGIDLGTTYSCVGVFQHGKVEIIANDQGNRTTPSYVAFTDTERLVGDPAKNQAALNPANTIFDAKRLIGRKFNDSTVQGDMKHWPFKVAQVDGRPKIKAEYKGEQKLFAPEEISSMFPSKFSEQTKPKCFGLAISQSKINVSDNVCDRVAARVMFRIKGGGCTGEEERYDRLGQGLPSLAKTKHCNVHGWQCQASPTMYH